MLELNLPSFSYKLKKKDTALFIFDIVRRKFVSLTPEEWVRQHFIHYLISSFQIPRNLISVERSFSYNNKTKRWDITVWDNNRQVRILIECKSPEIILNEKVLFQAGTYFSKINAEIIGITNGIKHIYFKRFNDSWKEFYDLTDCINP